MTTHKPNIHSEIGEIKRTASELNIDYATLFTAVKNCTLKNVTPQYLNSVENTDYSSVKDVNNMYKLAKEYGGKDISGIYKAVESKTSIDSPIILERPNQSPYLISGNTRLMYAKVHNLLPQVCIAHY
jgi:hypothetical protein